MHLSSEICELNPIEMVRHPHFYLRWISNFILVFGGGVNIVIEKYQNQPHRNAWMHVQWMLSGALAIALGDLWMHTAKG
jgi:hypothetical protein